MMSPTSFPHGLRRPARRAAALLCLALASCSDPAGPLAREGPPAELEFRVSRWPLGSDAVRLSHDTVVTVRTAWDAPGPASMDTVRAVPTAEQWRAFWAAADRAGVSQWRREYVTEGIMDGVGWELRLSANGRTVHSSGSNAFPDRRGREHQGTTTEFESFVAALEALSNGGSPPSARRESGDGR